MYCIPIYTMCILYYLLLYEFSLVYWIGRKYMMIQNQQKSKRYAKLVICITSM